MRAGKASNKFIRFLSKCVFVLLQEELRSHAPHGSQMSISIFGFSRFLTNDFFRWKCKHCRWFRSHKVDPTWHETPFFRWNSKDFCRKVKKDQIAQRGSASFFCNSLKPCLYVAEFIFQSDFAPLKRERRRMGKNWGLGHEIIFFKFKMVAWWLLPLLCLFYDIAEGETLFSGVNL